MSEIEPDLEALLEELSSLSKGQRKKVERHLSIGEKHKIKKVRDLLFKKQSMASADELEHGQENASDKDNDLTIYSPWLSSHLVNILDLDEEEISKRLTSSGKDVILQALAENNAYFSTDNLAHIAQSKPTKTAFFWKGWGRE